MIKNFFRKKIIEPVLTLLKQGVTPDKLARTFAVGIVVGVSPFVGLTTIICTGIAFAFRLNPVGINIANYLVYPLQIILIIPYLQAGSWLSGSNIGELNSEQLLKSLSVSPFQTLNGLGASFLGALGIWALMAIPVTLICYWLMLPLLKRFTPKIS